MPSLLTPFRAAGRYVKAAYNGLMRKSYGPVSRNSQLRRYLDGSAYGAMLSWSHYRETQHVAEGQGTPWTYICANARATIASEATITVYRDEDPRLMRGMMTKSIGHEPSSLENRLIDTADRLNDDYQFDNYGKLFWHPGKKIAWFVTADSTESEEAHAVAQALDDAGAPEVRLEAESSPPEDAGWIQLYPKQKRHLTKQGRLKYWKKACQRYSRRAVLKLKAIDHPHDLDKPQRQPVSDRDPLARILRRPNPGQSGAEFFAMVVFQIRVTGGAIIWKVKDKQFDRVRELYVIPTGLVQPFPPSAEYPFGSIRVTPLPIYTPMNGDGFVAPGALGELLTTGAIIDCRDIFKLGNPNPLYPADFLSPLKAGSMTVDSAGQMDRARTNSFLNVIKPGMIFECDEEVWKDVSPDEKEAWLQTITAANGGSLNFDKSFMPPPGITVKQVQRSPVEMDFVQSYIQLRDAEMALHQTPGIVGGIAQASAYSAYFAALKQFLDLVAQPELSMIARAFERALGPIFASYLRGGQRSNESARDLELDHGYEISIKAPKIDDPEILDRMMRSLIQGKAITKNEERQMYGLPPTKEKWGNDIAGTEPPPGADPLQALQGLIPGSAQAGAVPAAGVVPGQEPGAADGKPSTDTTPKKADEKTTGIANPGAKAPMGRPSVGPQQHTVKKSMGNWHGRWFKSEPHKYSTVYASLEEQAPMLADLFRAFAARIPKSELADTAADREKHVTVLHGLTTDEPADVAAVLVDVAPFGIRLHRTNVFQHPDKDVLYVDLDRLECKALVGLNALLKEKLPFVAKYPDFKPHLCIAYLKPGMGAKYQNDPFVDGLEITFDALTFAAAKGQKTRLPLGVSGQRASLQRTGPLVEKSYRLKAVDEEVCENPNCRSYGEAHPNCQCYDDKAVCAEKLVHKSSCAYYLTPGVAKALTPENYNGNGYIHPRLKEDALAVLINEKRDRRLTQWHPNGQVSSEGGSVMKPALPKQEDGVTPKEISGPLEPWELEERMKAESDREHRLPHVRDGMFLCTICSGRYHTVIAARNCCGVEPLALRGRADVEMSNERAVERDFERSYPEHY